MPFHNTLVILRMHNIIHKSKAIANVCNGETSWLVVRECDEKTGNFGNLFSSRLNSSFFLLIILSYQ